MTGPQDHKSIPQTPSPSALKQRLASLSPEKLAAFQQRLQQQERSGYEPLSTLPDEAVYPLSFHQQRLWFIEQIQPGTPLYNVTRAIRMRGSLNREALKSALESLVRRHEALRTTFPVIDGKPVQQINAVSELQLPYIDLRTAGTSGETAETLLQQQLTNEGRCSFDLEVDLMIRVVLYQIANDEHVLQVTIHHLCCDGWSLQLLFEELSVLYRGYCYAQVVELPPPPLRYVDFARWQRKSRQQELFTERVQWWKRQLAGVPQVFELATDRPRPQIESGSGTFQPLEIPPDLLERLETFCREEGVTLYMTLLTGFFILLHRYTGMEDFLVGSAVAGRHRPETHGIVGFFVDTIALRADLSGDPTARQVLQRVRQTVIDAINHSDVPFDLIVQSLNLPRDLSRHPLIQVLFNAPPQYTVELEDLDVSPVKVDLQIARFDLEMTYANGANRATGLTWSTDLFDEDTIRRMIGHYCALLKAMVVDPDQPVRQLPLLTEREQQLLVEWSAPQTVYPHDKCIHQLFEAQMELTPDAIALVYADQHLTYRELNKRANRLAHYLRSLGVGPEVLVGISMERSLELVMGILAILKAGGAYLPLDPTYPDERVQFMLEDAQVRFLLTQGQMHTDSRRTSSGTVVSHGNTHIHVIDIAKAEREICNGASAEDNNLESGVTPDNLAYVIYTSGSTGKPKGTMVSHYNVVRLFQSTTALFDFTASDTWTLFHSYAFDFSVWEIWGALFYGGKLLIVPYDVSRMPTEFAAQVAAQGVTILNQTPSAFRQLMPHLIAQIPPGQLPLRYVIFGGESLDLQSLQPWFAHYGDQQPAVVNMYGITETTVMVTYKRILLTDLPSEDVGSAIGKPLPDLSIYVLDPYQRPVPVGVPGELYVGGAGVSRGYLNRPELTATRFIADRLSNTPDAKLYRSGDLARWRKSGELEYFGRIDQQVKLRGFRIEPGEIEALLRQHPAIRDTIVILREDTPDDKRLVAYIVLTTDQQVTYGDLHLFLRTRVPDYMLPSAFVFLDRFPLTANGKLDRKALPAPESTRPELAQAFVAPRTPVEEVIAEIWREVLGLESVGIQDNFFALGGHSLRATQVIARINTKVHVAVSLRSMFQFPTVAAMAKLIAEQHGQQVGNVSLDRLLSELEALSDEEVERQLTTRV